MVLKKKESYWSTLENTKEPIRYFETVIREKESNIDFLSCLNHTSRLPNRDEGSFSLQSVSSVTQSCLPPCNPMDCSTPVFPVHQQLPELAQTHVRWVGDTIQPSYPLLSPSPPAFNLSQHQGLFQQVSSSNQVAKVLALQLHHQSFQWIVRIDFLRVAWFDLLAVQGIVRSLLHTTVQKHQFLSAQLFL